MLTTANTHKKTLLSRVTYGRSRSESNAITSDNIKLTIQIMAIASKEKPTKTPVSGFMYPESPV